MSYSVQQLAKLAGISVRTLHYYDQVGLLKPTRIKRNGYREYDDPELLRLQQVLFFRELDFPLADILRIMSAPTFTVQAALRDQRRMLEFKKKRISGLIRTIDRTLTHLNNQSPMHDEDLYAAFDEKEIQQYADEAKARWGDTDAYKQSAERTKHWTKDDYQRLAKDADIFMKKIVATMPQGAGSAAMQELVSQHYDSLRTFYEPNLTIYRSLADMYVNDPRFTAYYEKYAPGLATFMRDAMHLYCDRQEKKT